MWIRVLFFFFCVLSPLFPFKDKPLVFYHNMIMLEGNSGMRALSIQDLTQSDSVFFELGDVVEKKPIGFYLDTLSKGIFYNNYDVSIHNFNYQNESDFGKMYDVGKIKLGAGALYLLKQSITNETFDDFFSNKVPVADLNDEALFALGDLTTKANSKTNRFKHDILMDLNADGLKEKVSIDLSVGLDGDSNGFYSQELILVFFTRRGGKWYAYDKVKLNSDLEHYIDQVIFFKQKEYVNIYINSSSETLTGKVQQSQVLLVGSPNSKSVRITR